MNKIILIIISILISINLIGQKFSLETERIIGNDNDDNYTFFKIMDIKFNNDSGILILDRIRMSVSMYSDKGKFIKREGSSGQGPEEYASINSIGVGKHRIYVNDAMSNKFMVYDKNLNFIKQIKVEGDPIEILKVYDNNDFMTLNYFASKFGHGRFVKLNKNGKLKYSFFNKCWWGKFEDGNKRDDYIKGMGWAAVKGSYHSNKVIFGFRESDSITDIFIYSDDGKHIKTLKYVFKDKKYKFDPSKFTRKGFITYMDKIIAKKNIYEIECSSTFIYKQYYLVFMKYVQLFPGYRETDYNMFLVFDKSGKLLHEEDLCNDLTFFDIREDGYLVGADLKADVVTVQVHKLIF